MATSKWRWGQDCEIWKPLVMSRHFRRRVLDSVSGLLERGGKSPSIVAPMTEQPSLGSTLHTPPGEGARKGVLQTTCLKPPDWITASRGITTRSQKQKHRTMSFGVWNVCNTDTASVVLNNYITCLSELLVILFLL